MYCTCIRGMREAGYTRQVEGDLWVHAECGKPSRLVLEKLTQMRAPQNAIGITSIHGHTDGTTTVKFKLEGGTHRECLLYNPYPNKVDMNTPRDLLLEFWKELDASMDAIKHPSTANRDYYAARGRAQAEFIAKIMKPFYENADAVIREAMARWKTRQAGLEHETPGLAESIWDPQTRFDGTPYSRENEARVRAGGRSTSPKPKVSGNRIPDSAVKTAKQGIEMGMFTIAQMAETYKMTEVEVKEQLQLA